MGIKNYTIGLEQIKKQLQLHYDIIAELEPLVGYDDLNYLVISNDQQKFLLKISPAGYDKEFIDFQVKLHAHLKSSNNFTAPRIIPSKDFEWTVIIKDKNGQKGLMRLLTYIEGRLWSSVNPITDNLRHQLGTEAGLITKALSDFNHSFADRFFEWDIADSLWTIDYLHLFKKDEKVVIEYFISLFQHELESFKCLRHSIVHNDINDNNIIVSKDKKSPKIEAIIDFGDAIYTQTINDLAICCAYAIMNCDDPLSAAIPLVKGYNEAFDLKEEELKYLYVLIAMRLVVSVTKSALAKEKNPDNTYLLVSEKPAWDLLYKWKQTSADFAYYTFRHACGLDAHPNESKFRAWINTAFSIKDLIPIASSNEVFNLDLSVGSSWAGHEKEIEQLDVFQFKINQLQKQHPNMIVAGGYMEARGIYSSHAYDKMGNHGKESRTIHMGIDFWFEPGTSVHSLFDGEVVVAVNDKGNKEYGGLVILKHKADDFDFYTLYGHNTVKSATKHKPGDKIKKGDKIAELGDYPENGNWAPHLHFQIMLSMLDYTDDFPGVVYYNQLDIWKSIIPDPNLLFQLNELNPTISKSNSQLIDYRKRHLGRGLSLQYNKPLKIVKGSGQYLIDQNGRKYLDTVNNVAHVGHENYTIVKAGQKQMAILNTNTRYLHDTINDLTAELLKTLPEQLSVVHYVNSGSEANELALRMVKTVTGSNDILASEVGYHGNTNLTVDVSSYKFDRSGGKGAPKTTHIFPMPDVYKGKYRGKDATKAYASEVAKLIDKLVISGKSLGGLIIEPILSCGGQVELPDGFLKQVYKSVKDAGGLCISDEVQTGCGRMGKTFWGFQLHGVIPDIVTIGKPFGNGHPVAAVVCTHEVAEGFANGMEYFNTFGGNPVSCAIAQEVLLEIERQNLQAHALEIGNYLKSEFKRLSKHYPIIGDVRGQGLFLGVELVDKYLSPLSKQSEYLVNRMKDYGILMSLDGRDNNVIKIKPPMVFNKTNADEVIYYFEKVLKEDYMN